MSFPPANVFYSTVEGCLLKLRPQVQLIKEKGSVRYSMFVVPFELKGGEFFFLSCWVDL